MLRKLAGSVAALAVLVVLYLFVWPAPIDPVAVEPPKYRGGASLGVNRLLESATFLAEGRVEGPEDVAIDAEARLYTGTADGKVVRVALLSRAVEDFATTGGRPLGLRFDPAGNLVVCDAVKGLLAIDREGRVSVLATQAEGVPFRFTNNLDVAKDGTVYFSDASSKFGPQEYLYDLLEGRPHGRLLRYDPRTKETRVLLRDIWFANGVALSYDEDFVLVCETYRYRVLRYWLQGPKAGTFDVFVDNLPGFPDNLSRGDWGLYWLPLFTVRNPTVDWLHPRPFAKKVVSKLPRVFWPKPQPIGFVVALTTTGNVLRTFQDPEGRHVRQVTTAREWHGSLYLGTLDGNRIGRLMFPGSPLLTRSPD
jgi:sugar lactone lactonase YvrE